MKEEKRWIFPVFLPNLGCPYRCTFCDQHAVTGVRGGGPSVRSIDSLFNKVRFSIKNGNNVRLIRQIAFYGGNFSGLGQGAQKRYLDWASEKVEQGLIRSIRFSTRPDALPEEEIAFLKDYPVETIEVGVQSLNDAVLSAVHRGHTAEDCERAVSKVISNGWEAGVQLMPGLPGETLKGFLEGIETVSGWGIRYARLYPAVVLKGTRLAAEYFSGAYRPLSLEKAIEWCARACEIFETRGIQVIRVGLPASRELKASIMAGPYHAAFGFLVQSFRFHERLRAMIRNLPEKSPAVQIHLSPTDMPLLMGDRRNAWKDLKADFPGKEFAYYLDSGLAKGMMKLKTGPATVENRD